MFQPKARSLVSCCIVKQVMGEMNYNIVVFRRLLFVNVQHFSLRKHAYSSVLKISPPKN